MDLPFPVVISNPISSLNVFPVSSFKSALVLTPDEGRWDSIRWWGRVIIRLPSPLNRRWPPVGAQERRSRPGAITPPLAKSRKAILWGIKGYLRWSLEAKEGRLPVSAEDLFGEANDSEASALVYWLREVAGPNS